MALSDLELLDLVERAQNGRTGAQGAQGVGIRSIEQTSPESFTINLTDGTSKEIRFPKPEAGAVGATGQAGKDGSDSTVAGPRGPAGAPGRDGKDGLDGVNGASVDSALVNQTGELLIGLTDGQIISAGMVVGPAGATGDRGPVGLAGAPGRDGSSILSGYKAPNDAEDGQDGDFWIDLSSPQFDFYGPKRGGAWGGRTTFLKQPPVQENRPFRSMPVGGGSGGSGGGGGADLPTFEVVLPAGTETQVAIVRGEACLISFKVANATLPTQWTAGTFNASSTETVTGGEEFTVAAELFGPDVNHLDVTWRVVRNPTPDELTIFVTSPVNAAIKGTIMTVT